LNGLRDVLWLDGRNRLKIRDCARNLKNPVVRTGTQALLRHGSFKQTLAVVTEFAMCSDLT